ncbi:globin domain-containing protein [Roseomonas fluvialis]|uniref:Hemoglobin n=1 Tax=Roseomonas fluvialis TaxID=1750527 RepID=A0ABN6NXD3_9PROT|nr:globin domain-containing protein [Roseomonas fluvialis]BDG71086.1 hemoglobin [Roseomonas fluvialis]
MRLQDDDIDLVRGSFWHVSRMGPETAAIFHDRLFEIAPQTRVMFPTDLTEQGTKLMSMLGSIVARLHDHEVLFPMVADLARRHVAYGAQPAHYEAVGAALMAALSRTLGERFTPDVESAWRNAYDALARTMIEAAWPPEQPAS